MTNEIGSKIREARLQAGLKQKELAQKIGVSESRISQYEKGSQNPRIGTLMKLADALGVSLKSLCGDQWEEINYEDRTLHYSPFMKYLGSMGYHIESSFEDESLGNAELHIPNGGYVVFSPDNKKTVFSKEQFKAFEKAIADSVDYQIWQQNKNN